jgi:hypothetical protein
MCTPGHAWRTIHFILLSKPNQDWCELCAVIGTGIEAHSIAIIGYNPYLWIWAFTLPVASVPT